MFSTHSTKSEGRHLIRSEIKEAYLDFILSRQAMLCSKNTLDFYKYTAGKFVEWLKISSPNQLSNKHILRYLSELADRGLTDNSVHGHARAIRTFTKFLLAEKYVNEALSFSMPSIRRKQLPILTEREMREVIKACKTIRDKTLILFMVDCGIRRSEVCSLSWRDVDLSNGVAIIENGKGKKVRSVVIGVNTRRTLLAYRRTVMHADETPLFQSYEGQRLKPLGLRSILNRLGERTGLHITPHALNRTFATLSLKAGMNLLHLQAMLGHSSIDMTRHYVQMLDEDLVEAHIQYGPIDRFLKRDNQGPIAFVNRNFRI